MPWIDPRDRYRPGQYKQVDDRTGFVRYSSQTKTEWTGLVTDDPDPKHPQLYARGKRDYQAPPNPSPEGEDQFIYPGEVDPTDPSVLLTLRIVVSTDQRCIVGGELRKVP